MAQLPNRPKKKPYFPMLELLVMKTKAQMEKMLVQKAIAKPKKKGRTNPAHKIYGQYWTSDETKWFDANEKAERKARRATRNA